MLGVLGVGGSISPLFAGSSLFKHQGDSVWVGATHRVAMDTSFSCKSIAWLHQLCRHQCPSSSVGDEFNMYHQRLTLEGWFTKLEQTPLNHSEELPAPYKQLIDRLKQNLLRENDRTTNNLTKNK